MNAVAASGVRQLADASMELLADSPGRMPSVVEWRVRHVIAEIGRGRETVETIGVTLWIYACLQKSSGPENPKHPLCDLQGALKDEFEDLI